MSSGWVMLHRKLIEWEWYDDINTSRLFIHLLLTVNHKDNNWRGINIKRGSRLTSLDKISKETNLSVSKIRTSVNKLILTHELASKSHAQHTVFTVINYDAYQGDDKPDDKPVTNQSQSNDKALATNNNVKNENNVISKEKKSASPIDFSAFQLDDRTVSEIKAIRQKNKGGRWTQRVVNTIATEFQKAAAIGFTLEDVLNEWDTRGWKSFKAEWMPEKNNGISKITQKNIQNTIGDW